MTLNMLHRLSPFILICIVLGLALCASPGPRSVFAQSDSATSPATEIPPAEIPRTDSAPAAKKNLAEKKEFGNAELLVADQLAQSVNAAEWLGPLAPIALSPFFGISLLSALAMWGPDWMPTNRFLESSQALNNGWMFTVFITLTVVTSLPRLTKVSKPIAVALDRVETYGSIITLLVIRIMADPTADAIPIETPEVAIGGVTIMQAGVVSMTADVLFGIAMVFNIIVVNSVKFFFEFLIWLTPVPLIDALFETANKSFCAALMGLYAFSPTLATILNLVILFACAIALRWINRRVRFYRSMLFDPLLNVIFSSRGVPKDPELVVFPATPLQPFAPRSCLKLRSTDDHWHLTEDRLLLGRLEKKIPHAQARLEIRTGLLTNTLVVFEGDQEIATLTFSRRYNAQLQQMAALLKARYAQQSASDQRATSDLVRKAEFT
jgi:hypothetical protein